MNISPVQMNHYAQHANTRIQKDETAGSVAFKQLNYHETYTLAKKSLGELGKDSSKIAGVEKKLESIFAERHAQLSVYKNLLCLNYQKSTDPDIGKVDFDKAKLTGILSCDLPKTPEALLNNLKIMLLDLGYRGID